MTKTKYDGPWTQREGIELACQVQKIIEPHGFHVALAGSALTRGRSEKDLDLIIYPATTEHHTMTVGMVQVHRALEANGWVQVVSADAVARQWRRLGSKDEKICEVWAVGDRRVDLFFLR